jgi:hypothetical protein
MSGNLQEADTALYDISAKRQLSAQLHLESKVDHLIINDFARIRKRLALLKRYCQLILKRDCL